MGDSPTRVPLRNLDAEPAVSPTSGEPGTVRPGARVTLHFALALDADTVVDSNFDAAPATFTVGDGSLLPGFEQALLGRRAGERVEAVIASAAAFGPSNPDNLQRFPHYRFPPDLALSENLLVEFGDAAGYTQAGRVVAIGKQYVEVDFNHPLAGRDILFSAAILRIDDPA